MHSNQKKKGSKKGERLQKPPEEYIFIWMTGPGSIVSKDMLLSAYCMRLNCIQSMAMSYSPIYDHQKYDCMGRIANHYALTA